MLLHRIVDTSRRVAETRSRREKIARLADCLAQLPADEVRSAVAFLAGELRQGKIGVGYAAVRESAVAAAAEAPSLTVNELDRELERIRDLRGAGSQAVRLEALRAVLRRATRDEQQFLRRLLVGEVRQGALEGVMVEAIAAAAGVAPAEVRRAAMLSGDLGDVAVAALTGGETALAGISIELFRPLQPMLAQTADGVADALDRLGDAALEWKLDGARVQVHRDGDEVAVFTRRLRDVTAAVPEVVAAALLLPVRRIILDGEVLAVRPGGRPHPFQVTMRRFGRRLDVDHMRDELPLRPFFFDCLHLDGEDLIDRSGAERADAFGAALPADLQIPRLRTDSPEAAESFLAAALQAGHEGVVAKSLVAPYEAGRRGAGWLKVKPTHTLDLVVLAAEWGSGRRRGWLSNLHLGARDAVTGEFVMLGKTFKGLTDEILTWQTVRLQELAIARDEHTVFVRPALVVEIAFDGVQTSPHYPGGLALRFARVVRYRPDKSPAGADTIDAVRAIHSAGA